MEETIYKPNTILRCKVDNLVAWKSWIAVDFVPIPTDRDLKVLSEKKEYNLRHNRVVYTLELSFFTEKSMETRRVFLNPEMAKEEAREYFEIIQEPVRIIPLLPPKSVTSE